MTAYNTAQWPITTVTIAGDQSENGSPAVVRIDRMGTVHTLEAESTLHARAQARSWIAENVAAPMDRAAKVTIDDPEGLWHVTIDPAGRVAASDHGTDRPKTHPAREASTPAAAPEPPVTLPPAPSSAAFDLHETDAPALSSAPPPEPQSRREAREQIHERPSFITAGRAVQPAQHGWRGTLNGLGLRLAPGPDELAMRRDVEAVSQHWGGPRTIAVVNGKGSAAKTPTTACLAAVFARHSGAGVLAWDNNETRGSLAWRTEASAHKATVLDLLPHVDKLMSNHAQHAEMAHYVHHQPADKYDVLWSDQSVEGDHIVTAEEVDLVHQVAARYYRMVVMDSGNSERAPNWRAMVEHADRLVVPCTNVEDTAEAGARLIEALAARDERSAALARNAIVLVSQRTAGHDPNLERIVKGFREMGLSVVTVPYDPALQTGVIRHDALRPATQRAWLHAAAEVARGLPS